MGSGPAARSDPPCVLVFGGGGVFGRRLVDGILATTHWRVVVAGRNPTAPAADGPAHGRVTTQVLNTRTATPDDLRATGAFAVVDAAGPFQSASYDLARSAIAAGLHYIDLADGRDFVAGFETLDADARAARVVALTGASSTPALSNAVLDWLTRGWRRVDTVEVTIAPGNRAPRGRAVMQSILSYSGSPVRIFQDGRWCEKPGWGMTRRVTIPGLSTRYAGLVETPDLDVIVKQFAVRESVTFRAGMELAVLQLGLLAASLLVRAGVIRSLLPFTNLFRRIAAWLQPFGTDRGGMLIEATGIGGEGLPVRAAWWLIAEAGDGPMVPTLPALAALRALAQGGRIASGASACVRVLGMGAILAEADRLRITTDSLVRHPPPSLYQLVLGPAFNRLPPVIQAVHRPGFGLRASGTARVDGADTLLSRIISRAFRFPVPCDVTTVTVRIAPLPRRERWVRDFGGRVFSSVLAASTQPGGLTETFGPFRFELDLRTDDTGVTAMAVRAWRILGIPLPSFLAPVSRASERVDDAGRFFFDVELRLPLGLGRLVRYRGWLRPDHGP